MTVDPRLRGLTVYDLLEAAMTLLRVDEGAWDVVVHAVDGKPRKVRARRPVAWEREHGGGALQAPPEDELGSAA